MYDVIVIGGGPAGLLAAVYLARFKRSVALVDAGNSRVARIPQSHNYPGFADGISGVEVRDKLRVQASRYPIAVTNDFVERAERRETGFHLTCASGSMEGRLLLLATGVTDIPPALPNVRAALDSGALRYCPVCDAFEVVDKAIGVYADGEAGVGEAIYLRHFSDDVVLFMAQGGTQLKPAHRERLAAAGVGWNEAPVEAIRREGTQVVIAHGGGETRRDTLYCALGVNVHSQLASSLGATLDATGYIRIDAHHVSDVPGLYAAGDVASGLNQISVALGGAAIAAAAMHRALPPAWQRVPQA